MAKSPAERQAAYRRRRREKLALARFERDQAVTALSIDLEMIAITQAQKRFDLPYPESTARSALAARQLAEAVTPPVILP